MEAACGVFFLNLPRVVAEHFRRFRPSVTLYRCDMTVDVMRQVDVVVFPDDEDFSMGKAGEGIELLRQ